ncbi:hypothetical protein TRIUR3_08989 [Triticum urartu]|uniref:Uncharacterized protein n=1 Tax=Triticum urartu TaxID=4572 RepID=M7Y955_TRIUA|nr:hypothetical protein TRIUR3_08989 [Triticum urartu]
MWTEMGMEIWERKLNSDGALGWVLQQIIQLDKLLPPGSLRDTGFWNLSVDGYWRFFLGPT